MISSGMQLPLHDCSNAASIPLQQSIPHRHEVPSQGKSKKSNEVAAGADDVEMRVDEDGEEDNDQTNSQALEALDRDEDAEELRNKQ